MKKILLTYCDYPATHPTRLKYEQYTKHRFLEYSYIHNFEFIEINENCAKPYNLGFAKVFWIQQNWNNFKPGDVITYMDIDCCIMDARIPAIFDKDFSIVQESTGCLCMGGTWSLIVSDWSKIFIDGMCSHERQVINKDLPSWKTWHENDAIYHVLGLNWGAPVETIGSRETTPFNKETLNRHVRILEAKWGVTYNPDDIDWDKNSFLLYDQADPDGGYKIIGQYYNPERYYSIENTIVRHLSAGTMNLPWAEKYYSTKMKI